MGKKGAKLLAALLDRRAKEPDRIFQQTPKPPKNDDGSCSCGCCHVTDYGACPHFYQGANGRCARCDHSKACHRRKGEPPPKNWNNPVELMGPHKHVLSPSAFACPCCGCKLMQCPKCRKFIPLKDYDSGYHIACCPTCSYFDLACPKPKEEAS